MMTRVFVYGTLMTGERNHRLLEGARFLGAYETHPGWQLVEAGNGAFPAAVPERLEDGTILGEVWEVDDRQLAGLDYLEGVEWGHYLRGPVPVREAGTGLEAGTAQIYFQLQSHDRPSIHGGDWRAHKTRTDR